MNFRLVHGIVFCMVLFVTVSGQYLNPFVDYCSGQPDHTYLKSKCFSYIECINETQVETMCPSGQVLQRSTKTCVPIGSGDTDCGLPVDCTGKLDAMYTDPNYGCQTFYHCIDEVFYPNRIYCPPGLYFYLEKQWCDYKYNVPPPCGTRNW